MCGIHRHQGRIPFTMKVTHCREMIFTVYIGRPSVFGNPFIVGVHGDRATCIAKFKKYAWRNQRVLDAIQKLPRKAILGCHCSPKPCHGDAIIRIWKQLTREANEHAELIAAKRPTTVSRMSGKSRSVKNLHDLPRKGRSDRRGQRK